MVANGQEAGQLGQDHHRMFNATQTAMIEAKADLQETEAMDDLDDNGSKFSSTASHTTAAPLIPTTAELRTCSSSEFKKSPASSAKKYAIEILPAEAQQLRSKRDTKVAQPQKNEHTTSATRKSKMSSGSGKPRGAALVPDKIRIFSFEILAFLSKFDKEINPRRPIVMEGPFKFLVHHEKQIREFFDNTRNQVNEEANSESSTDYSESMIERSMPDEAIDAYLAQNGNENVRHLACLIDFMDTYVMPTVERLRKDEAQTIRFKDLWYIFEPGEIIYMPIKYSGRTVSPTETLRLPETLRGRYNRMWRVVGVGEGRNTTPSALRQNSSIKAKSFTVSLYHIDFDGRFYIPITHTFDIMPFEGEKEIRSLDFFPLRFTREFDSAAQGYFDTGKEVFDCMRESFTHFYYAGPTLMTQPCGCPFTEDEVHQQYIESEVIVDFRAALMQHQAWRPDSLKCRNPQRAESELEDRSVVTYWTGNTRGQGQAPDLDQVYDDYYIDMNREGAFKDREIIFAPISSSWICNESSMPDKDIKLLPPRVFAFVLRTRSFAPLLLWALRPIKAQTSALHNLQLKDDAMKDTVEALVRTHFLKNQTESRLEVNHDSLRGRGRGLVILLHGAPGVGKTYTAESLAAANGKPLFQISCGDLGLSPKEVEKSLRDIFRYAQMWKCVLLLDECDVFLAQRGKDDIKRNALVCVFLRVLEFYTGILFLTTNRVGVIDDAVRSRITWMAYYPPLNERQTREIWKTNLQVLTERNPRLMVDRKGILQFAREHFTRSQQNNSNWDGRQIQNAFQVAVSLADWEHFSDKTKHEAAAQMSADEAQSRYPVTAAHFQQTAAGVEETDQYLRQATGFTGPERAFNAMERADDYKEVDEETLPLTRTASLPEGPKERRPSAALSPKKRDSLSYIMGNTHTNVSRSPLAPQQQQGTIGSRPRRVGPPQRRETSPLYSPPSRKSSLSVAIHQPNDRRPSQTHLSPPEISGEWHETTDAEEYESDSARDDDSDGEAWEE